MCWSVSSHWSSCYGFKYDVEYPYLFYFHSPRKNWVHSLLPSFAPFVSVISSEWSETTLSFDHFYPSFLQNAIVINAVLIYLPLFTPPTQIFVYTRAQSKESAPLVPCCFIINSLYFLYYIFFKTLFLSFVALLSAWLVRISLFFFLFCFYFDFFALYGKYGTAKIPGIWNKVCMFAICVAPCFILLLEAIHWGVHFRDTQNLLRWAGWTSYPLNQSHQEMLLARKSGCWWHFEASMFTIVVESRIGKISYVLSLKSNCQIKKI